MQRIALFLLTNLAVMVLAGITLNLLGVGSILAANGIDLNPSALLAFCAEQLARYKRPREVVFVTNIPKTPSGKIQKPLLRDAYLDGRVLP